MIKRITSALILFVLPTFTYAAGLVPCGGPGEGACGFNDFLQLIENLINLLAIDIAIPLTVLLFIYAGVLYLTAAGRDAQITKAKKVLQATVIGFVIAISGWLIVRTVVNVFVPEDQRSDYDQFLEQVDSASEDDNI